MRKKLRLYVMLFVAFLSLAGVNAQSIVASWEAEDFVGLGFKPDGNNFPYVKSEGHSGGYYVQRISQSNSLFYMVNVATAGVYDLTVYYMIKANGGQIGSDFGVRVNDQIQRKVTVTEYTDTDTSTETKSITVPVYLDAGDNTIRIGHNKITSSGYTPNFDKFELSTSTQSFEKPETDDNYGSVNDFKTLSALDGYTTLPHLFTITSQSNNATLNNLVDNDQATKFISTNDTETFTLYFPEGTGFALRNLIFDTNSVTVLPYSIQKSKTGDEESWIDIPVDARFINLYYGNKGTTIGEWKTGDNSSYDYRYYRFTIKKTPGAAQMELGEMKIYGLYQGLEDITESKYGTAFTSNTNIDGSNGVNNAVMNDATKKFCISSGENLNVIFKFNDSAKVTAYSLANAATPGTRDPKSWIFEASNDSINFVELDKVENFTWYMDRRCQDVRKIDNTNSYKYYRLTVTAKQGTDNYWHIGEFQMFGTVYPLEATVSGLVVDNKTYDGNTTATVSSTGSLVGIEIGDDVSVAVVSATFADKVVATGKTVNVVLQLQGVDASKYALIQPTDVTANITTKELSVSDISIHNKVYDGNATATLNNQGTLTGKVSADDVALNSGITASFDNKNVGTAKSVTLSALSLTGADALNYTLTQPTGLKADVSAKTLTIADMIIADKVHDGTTNATVSSWGTLQGIVEGDVVSINHEGITANFNNADAGTNKIVTLSGDITLSGADAGNYTLTQPAELTASITNASRVEGNTVGALLSVYTIDKCLVFDNKSGNVVTYQVYDITGKQMIQGTFVSSHETTALPQGLYIVRATVSGKNITTKILIK